MSLPDRRHHARSPRAQVETALDRIGWRWNARLSAWRDALVLLEEQEHEA